MASKNTTRGASIDSEKKIDAWLRVQIKKAGGRYIKLPTDLEAGLPDRLVLLDKGVAFFIETKSTGDKPRPIQMVQHKKLRALCFSVYIIDSMAKAKSLINMYIK